MVKIIMNLLNEYEWSNDQCIFPKTDRNSVLDDTFTIFTLNVRSLLYIVIATSGMILFDLKKIR